jgi:hypothetical protein
MIHSRVMTDSDRSEPSFVRNVWTWSAALLVIGFIFSLARPAGSSIPDIWIWRPIMLGACLASCVLWLKLFFRRSVDQAWAMVKGGVPFALVSGLAFGLIGLGPLGSGSLPLSLKDFGGYFLTLGFWSLSAGPEAFLRGFILCLALYLVWQEYRSSRQDLKAALGGLGIWVVGSLAILLPSIIIWIVLWADRQSASSLSGSELMVEFSRLNINTYWSNLQLTRWFTGFGGSLPNMVAMFTASWVSIIGAAVVCLTQARRVFSLAWIKDRTDLVWHALFGFGALAVGVSIGWGRSPHSSLDLVAWLVFIILSLLFVSLDRSRIGQAWQLPIILILAGLLGWPVLLPGACILCLIWLIGVKAVDGSWLTLATSWAIWPIMSAVGLAFVRSDRNNLPGMIIMLLAYALLCLPALVLKHLKDDDRAWFITAAVWLGASLAGALLARDFVILALAIIGIAVCHAWYKFKKQTPVLLSYVLLVYPIIVLVAAFWLPRWLNPRLLPL